MYVTNGQDSNAVPGRVTGCSSNQSYLVEMPTGTSRRNRNQLNIRAEEQSIPLAQENSALIPSDSGTPRSPIATRLRTRTVIKPPDKLTL